MTVSLVGYTNAGKSTLLNRLTGADVFTQDALFSTLDTRTRRWQLPAWGPVLLSDTVGFIRNLPHHLIASFQATLEEARQAHLLLHVADASSPAVLEQISAAYSVLEEIGLAEKDSILVLNKIDALDDRVRLQGLKAATPARWRSAPARGPGCRSWPRRSARPSAAPSWTSTWNSTPATGGCWPTSPPTARSSPRSTATPGPWSTAASRGSTSAASGASNAPFAATATPLPGNAFEMPRLAGLLAARVC